MSVEVETRGFLEGLTKLHAAISSVAALASVDAVRAAEEEVRKTRIGKHRKRPDAVQFKYDGTRGSLLVVRAIKPYEIHARGRALRFVVAGTVLYRRMVRNPGLRPEPFVERAREVGAEVFVASLERRLAAVIRSAR